MIQHIVITEDNPLGELTVCGKTVAVDMNFTYMIISPHNVCSECVGTRYDGGSYTNHGVFLPPDPVQEHPTIFYNEFVALVERVKELEGQLTWVSRQAERNMVLR